MDCFYAAVEVKYRPELKGKPLGIGGPPNTRSVLTTASYEARKFGVRSAMPSSQALRLCPDLILVPPRMELYKQESRAVREIMRRFTDQIEPLSLDEAYLDVTEAAKQFGSATMIAKEIRRLIEDETKLTASAGVAPNKFLAKIASDWKKPNGLFVIKPEDVDGFMPSLKVEKIFGVGKVTAKKMHDLGLKTCGDIQRTDLLQLSRWFGSRAKYLADLSRGIDERAVEPHGERKSLSTEWTYNTDIPTLEECLLKIPDLYDDWAKSMERVKHKSEIRGHTVKIKFHDFTATTRENSSKEWPTIADFERLMAEGWKRHAKPVRLLGLGVKLADREDAENADQLRFEIP